MSHQILRFSEVRPFGEEEDGPQSIILLKNSWSVTIVTVVVVIIGGQLAAWRATASCVYSWVWKYVTGQIKDRSQARARAQSRTVGQGASACSPVGCGSLGNQAGF